MEWMGKADYDHYEISNFSKPGWRSRHNSSYWQGKQYLGFGPSAHSFRGNIRQWNISNNALYIKSLKNNLLPVETELLTITQQVNEYIMTSLRTMEGMDLQYLEKKYGILPVRHIEKAVKKHIDSGKINAHNWAFRLTTEGKLYADGIAADLFL
jgi:oxygen-independent coproporphyrinogen-3 oxidase